MAAELRTDAKREGAVPRGGVETGAGGSQRTDPLPINPLPILVGGLVLLVLCGAGTRGQAGAGRWVPATVSAPGRSRRSRSPSITSTAPKTSA